MVPPVVVDVDPPVFEPVELEPVPVVVVPVEPVPVVPVVFVPVVPVPVVPVLDEPVVPVVFVPVVPVVVVPALEVPVVPVVFVPVVPVLVLPVVLLVLLPVALVEVVRAVVLPAPPWALLVFARVVAVRAPPTEDEAGDSDCSSCVSSLSVFELDELPVLVPEVPLERSVSEVALSLVSSAELADPSEGSVALSQASVSPSSSGIGDNRVSFLRKIMHHSFPSQAIGCTPSVRSTDADRGLCIVHSFEFAPVTVSHNHRRVANWGGASVT